MQDYNHEGKKNLKLLEGEEEIFVDLLEDIGVLTLQKDGVINHGEYVNQFTCIDAKNEPVDEQSKKNISIIEANFYEQETTIFVKVIDWVTDGELNDREVYWLDEMGSESPKDNPNFYEICENLDIFFDEM